MVKQEAFDLRARFSDINLSFFSSSYFFIFKKNLFGSYIDRREKGLFGFKIYDESCLALKVLR